MENIVDMAENVIKSIRKPSENNPNEFFIGLKISQLRKILSAINILKNKVDIYKINNPSSNKLSTDLAMEVKFLRINIAYQAGREPKQVKPFVEKAKLLTMIDNIKDDIKSFEVFCKYVEALVAFHKFYGGKD